MSVINNDPTRGTLEDREQESFVTVDGKFHKAALVRPDPDGDTFPISTDDLVVTGTLAANGAFIEVSTVGRSSLTSITTGAISSFVTTQGTVDGTAWFTLPLIPVVGGEATIFMAGSVLYSAPCAGLLKVRIIASFWSAGSSSVRLTASAAPRAITSTGVVRSTQPAAITALTAAIPGINKYGMFQSIDSIKVFTEWGKAFRVTTDYISTGVSVQAPLMLLRNPAGSGTIIKILGITFQVPATGSCEYRVYNSPTVTAAGTPLVPVGNRQTGQAAAIGLMYRLPTVSAFGLITTALHLQNTTTPTRDDSGIYRWLDPGNDMLITTEKSGAGVLTSVTVDYVEQP